MHVQGPEAAAGAHRERVVPGDAGRAAKGGAAHALQDAPQLVHIAGSREQGLPSLQLYQQAACSNCLSAGCASLVALDLSRMNGRIGQA